MLDFSLFQGDEPIKLPALPQLGWPALRINTAVKKSDNVVR
jgi:hypothetical protein